MSDPISTNPCSHLGYIFSSDHSHDLGIDHHGHQVLTDMDGPGVFHTLFPNKNLCILTGETKISQQESSFDSSLTVTSKDKHPFYIFTIIGPKFEPKNLKSNKQNARLHNGPCWVLPGSGPFVPDDIHEEFIIPPNSLPFPVFHNVRGENLNLQIPPNLQTIFTPILNFNSPDSFEKHNWKVQNISEVRDLTSTFPDNTESTSPKACHLNRAQFTIPVDPNHTNLILRKTYDRFHGRQRARVLINKKFAGWWYLPHQNRIHRWAIAHFPIPPTLTQDQSEITITIDPPAAVPLWDFASYDLLTVTQTT